MHFQYLEIGFKHFNIHFFTISQSHCFYIYLYSGFDNDDANEIWRLSLREFVKLVDMDAFKVLQYGCGMLLKALQNIDFGDDKELPPHSRKQLEVRYIYLHISNTKQ